VHFSSSKDLFSIINPQTTEVNYSRKKSIAPQFYREQGKSNATTQKVSTGYFISKVFSVISVGEIFESLVK